MQWGFDKDITVSELIEIQRRLARAEKPFDRLVGTLWAAGTLESRLAQLTDHQIGQLLTDFVDDQLGLFEPEMTICQQATRRLFRSASGTLPLEVTESAKERTPCPRCGSEMLLHYGIDEPDYLECTVASCGYRMPA
jgi:hypothetical protein